MAINTEVVHQRFINIAENVDVNVPIPLFAEDEVVVTYGNEQIVAEYGMDYDVVLNEDDDYADFIILPLEPLIDKITALGDGNFIDVTRRLDYTTSISIASAANPRTTAREFDRTIMRFQQLAYDFYNIADAAGSALLARLWATAAEDVEPDPANHPGEFSAFHWASKAAADAATVAANIGSALAAATSAAASAVSAAADAAAALVSKNAAAGSATAASGSATAAAGSASAASGSATAAATSATNAGNSATAAAGSATTASTQATNASNSATAAAGSATTAANILTSIQALTTGVSSFWLGVIALTTAAASWITLQVVGHLTTRTAIKALVPQAGMSVFLNEGLRAGVFSWRSGDYSAEITRDTQEGVYLKANSVASSAGAWVREGAGMFAILNVLWFGADPTFAADSAPAINGAKSVLEYANDYRGGEIRIPKGNYKCNSTIDFTWYSGGVVHNMVVHGDGMLATTLNFSSAGAGTNGISFGPGVGVNLSDLMIAGAKNDGLALDGGVGGFISQYSVKRVRIQTSTRYGVYANNTYLGTMEDVWSASNGAGGVLITGFHTSLRYQRVYASGNTGAFGWQIDGVTYSSFITCASDSNQWAYVVQNCNGVAFIGCGCESNAAEGWLLRASTAIATGRLAECQDIKGVSFINCFNLDNNHSGPAGSFANFMSLSTLNSKKIEVSINGCTSWAFNVADYAIVASGSSGRIKISETMNSFDTGVFQTGDVVWEGRQFSWTPAIVGSGTAGAGTYTSRVGRYIIEDGWVTVDAWLVWTAHTGTGNIRLSLPFTHKNDGIPAIATIVGSNLAFTGQLTGYVDAGQSQITLLSMTNGAALGLQAMDTAATLGFRVSYPIA